MSTYAVLDFETTGLSAQNGDRAIEIGIVMIEDGEIGESYQSLINPGHYISGEITSITGITNAMVHNAPPPQQVFREVDNFVGDATLVAHNAAFDRRFWQSELPKAGLQAEHSFLCTLLLSRRLYPNAYNHRLQTLVEMHGLATDGTYHRALADASMTARLLQRILDDLSQVYPDDTIAPTFLSKYQQLPKAKTRNARPRANMYTPA